MVCLKQQTGFVLLFALGVSSLTTCCAWLFLWTDVNDRRKVLNNVVNCRLELTMINHRISEMSRSRLLLQVDVEKHNQVLNKKHYNLQLVQHMVEDVRQRCWNTSMCSFNVDPSCCFLFVVFPPLQYLPNIDFLETP